MINDQIMEETEILMYFDGSSKSNGGPSGAGYWVDLKETSYGGYKFLGNTTNNEAEYNGLIIGLKAISNMKNKKIIVHGDSKLVIEQMKGKWKINAPNLKPLWEEAQELIKDFKNISFIHIDRSLNSKADKLANIAVNTRSHDIL
jgi:ribonuclease HI